VGRTITDPSEPNPSSTIVCHRLRPGTREKQSREYTIPAAARIYLRHEILRGKLNNTKHGKSKRQNRRREPRWYRKIGRPRFFFSLPKITLRLQETRTEEDTTHRLRCSFCFSSLFGAPNDSETHSICLASLAILIDQSGHGPFLRVALLKAKKQETEISPL
jgi:hypothetical protein